MRREHRGSSGSLFPDLFGYSLCGCDMRRFEFAYAGKDLHPVLESSSRGFVYFHAGRTLVYYIREDSIDDSIFVQNI